jgi:hypothetical protein
MGIMGTQMDDNIYRIEQLRSCWFVRALDAISNLPMDFLIKARGFFFDTHRPVRGRRVKIKDRGPQKRRLRTETPFWQDLRQRYLTISIYSDI